MCKLYTNLYDLKTVIFRYFNVYGEGAPSTGQYAPVIGIFLRQKNEGKPLTIVGNGEQSRDFVHVQDVVNANIMAAISNVEDQYYGQIYNIGNGENISILELANMISNNHIHISPRDGEAKTTLASIDKAKQTFGWSPQFKIRQWIEEINNEYDR